MSHLTTHVLDVARGLPAAGIPVLLGTEDGDVIATAITDDDGRVGELGPALLEPGTYLLSFETADYHSAHGTDTLFPGVTLSVAIGDAPHYHVPLLITPFGLTTYRGS